jgi:hypothetical protein
MMHLHQSYETACHMNAELIFNYFECFMDELDLVFDAIGGGMPAAPHKPNAKELLRTVSPPENWVKDASKLSSFPHGVKK